MDNVDFNQLKHLDSLETNNSPKEMKDDSQHNTTTEHNTTPFPVGLHQA